MIDIYQSLYYAYDDMHYNVNGISMVRWSRACWGFLHGFSILYPEYDMNNIITNIKTLLPCGICAFHFHIYVSKHIPPPQSCTKSNVWAQWLVTFHNDINKRTHKKEVQYADVYASLQNGKNQLLENVRYSFWEFVWIVSCYKKSIEHKRLLVEEVSKMIDIPEHIQYIDQAFNHQKVDDLLYSTRVFQILWTITEPKTLFYTLRWLWKKQNVNNNNNNDQHCSLIIKNMLVHNENSIIVLYTLYENIMGKEFADLLLTTEYKNNNLINVFIRTITDEREQKVMLLKDYVLESKHTKTTTTENNIIQHHDDNVVVVEVKFIASFILFILFFFILFIFVYFKIRREKKQTKTS